MLLGAGAIASTCIPEHTFKLYFWAFLGCYLSAWEAYWIGRLFGPRLYTIPLFRSIITPKRLEILRTYYAKFGVFTFILGRFCPGGIRNTLFTSSGVTKMPFPLFILRDGIACLISSSVIFYIGYRFGQNFDCVLYYFHRYDYAALFIIVSLALAVITYIWYINRSKRTRK